MIDRFLDLLRAWAELLPLPIFTIVGSFVEEIIAPIPSPFVMTLAGSLAEAESRPLVYLFFLAAIGAVGKTVGSVIIYFIADRFEDAITGRFGKFIGVSHKQVMHLSERLEKGRGEWAVLFALRALPIMPTAPISLASGVLRVNMKTYLTSTAAGLFVRNIFYLYLGYTSTNALERLNSGLDSFETIGYAMLLIAIAAILAYIYRARRKHHH